MSSDTPTPDEAEVPATVSRSLYAVQVALVAATGLIAAALVVLALLGLWR